MRMPIERSDTGPEWAKVPLCFPATLLSDSSLKRRIIEIGPGRGDFLFHLAETNKTALVIAVELRSKRYFKLIDRTIKRKAGNVLLIQADGRETIASFFKPKSIDEIHINFPDPWPKKKHSKNRLISKELLANCAKILKTGGGLNIVTDSKAYAESIKTSSLSLESVLKEENPDSGVFPSFFAQKWKNEGRNFYIFKWSKISSRSDKTCPFRRPCL